MKSFSFGYARRGANSKEGEKERKRKERKRKIERREEKDREKRNNVKSYDEGRERLKRQKNQPPGRGTGRRGADIPKETKLQA